MPKYFCLGFQNTEMTKVINIWTDEELLHRCSNDDLQAYNLLFDRYAPRLYKLGMRYLKDHFAVEELAIDVLYSIWVRRNTLNIQTEFSAYLFRAMHNSCISFLRRAKLVTVDIADFSVEAFPDSQGADYGLALSEAENRFKEILTRLSPQRRKVFELSREQNLSYAEIAEELNLSQNTVENHMVAALSFLRKQYLERPAFLTLLIFSLVFLN